MLVARIIQLLGYREPGDVLEAGISGNLVDRRPKPADG
jgi:hypothetical protein